MTELTANIQPQDGALPPAGRENARPAAATREGVRVRRQPSHCCPGGLVQRAPAVGPQQPNLGHAGIAKGGRREEALDAWMEAAAELTSAHSGSGQPSLPPRGELLTMTFRLDDLEVELDSLLYRLAFDSGSWVVDISMSASGKDCHLRLLVYEDAAVIAEILSGDDRPALLPPRAAKAMQSLGWEPPTQPSHPMWTAGTPVTHADISGLSAMIIATLRHVLGLRDATALVLTLYGS